MPYEEFQNQSQKKKTSRAEPSALQLPRFYNSMPINSHLSLVMSSSEKVLEEVLTDEKLPHLAERGPPGVSVCIQWTRVTSSKPTQPRSRTRPSAEMCVSGGVN